jgi:iron complex outermembrane receptor protein
MKKLFTQILGVIAISLSLVGNVYAQNKSATLSGTIKTSDGKPAAYVNVGLKNTNKVTQTDENGVYTIKNIQAGSYSLKISAVGITSQEKGIIVTDGASTTADFSVSESSSRLAEVAVMGYKTPNKKPVNLGKINIAPIDLPQAVQIIGNQVITDQQANRLSDVLKNVNGVAFGENRGSVSGETFFARGYSLGGNNVFKNGSRQSSGGMPETSTLESVEVLKGSAALLYGGVTGGAVVNMVTKKPKFENGGEVAMRSGSYSLYKPTVDVYGPISKKLAFRVISTYENAGSFRNDVTAKRAYINPSLLYKINEKTDILLQGDYLKSDFTPDFGVGTVANKIVDFGRDAFLNTPWAYNRTNSATSQLNVNHKFNSNWKLNVLANLQSYNRNYFSAERPFADATGTAARNLTRSKTKEFTYNEQINLNGFAKTGSVEHTILVGVDADQSRTTSNGFVYPSTANTANPYGLAAYNYGNVNLLDPSTYFGSGVMPETRILTNTFAPVFRMGGFVQDLVALTEKFKVLAGVRWTFQKTPTTDITNVITGVETKGTAIDKIDKAFSPKFGLVYQPLKTTSFYVSYANNFTSNTGIDIATDAPMGPSIIDQYEAGVKNDFFQGKLSANLTVYKIKNSNLAQTALADATKREFSGSTSSDGAEFDLTGSIVPGLNFLAGYSYNFMRYTSTIASGAVEGQRLVGTTKNTANGTLFYTLQEGSLKGLKLGASAFYTGNRNGGYNDTKTQTASRLIPLSAFTTFDLSVGYNWRKLSLLGKVSNLTNELNYYVHENYSVNPIPPRQFMTTLSYKF